LVRHVSSAGADDIIRFPKLDRRVTILVDGASVVVGNRQTVSVQCNVDDAVFRGAPMGGAITVDVPIGNLVPLSGCRSEVVVFAADHAMEFRQVTTWTAMPDVFVIRLQPRVKVPVKVWILYDDTSVPGGTAAQAQAEVGYASQIYNLMAGGIMFDPTVDTTRVTTTDGELLQNICSNAQYFKDNAGFDAGMLNVYYIQWIAPTTKAMWCGADGEPNMVLAAAPMMDPETLAHEFGHAFTLEHSNDRDPMGNELLTAAPGIPVTNLMLNHFANLSSLTNGQVFRANLNQQSRVNKNGNRRGTTRTCAHNLTNRGCPALSLDLFPK